MIERIIDFAERPGKLSVRGDVLQIESEGIPRSTVPLGEIAVLIAAHPQLSCTKAVMSGLMEAGAILIACDDRSMPVGMMFPLTGFHAPVERFSAQASAPLPTRKRLWTQVIASKIRAQGNLLIELHDDDFGLIAMSKRVRSGDPSNLEAQASRKYWPVLFADPEFRRRRELDDQNRLLNYGYAVVRALVARSICAAGLHPCLGIHHHHRSNPFCLADDLMEPFRPIVDREVALIVSEWGKDAPLDRPMKARLIGAPLRRFSVQGEQRTIFDILVKLAASLAAVFVGESKELILPDL